MSEYFSINREFYRGNELVNQPIMMFLSKDESEYQLKRINSMDPYQTKYKYSIQPQDIEFKEVFKPGDRIIYRSMYAKVISQDHQWLFTDVFKPIDVTHNLILWAGNHHPSNDHPKLKFANENSWQKYQYEDHGYPAPGF